MRKHRQSQLHFPIQRTSSRWFTSTFWIHSSKNISWFMKNARNNLLFGITKRTQKCWKYRDSHSNLANDSPSERTIECQKYNNNGLVLMMSSYRGRKRLMAICWAHCSRLRLQRLLWCSPVVGDKVFLLSTLINLIRLNWASKQNSAAFPLKTFAFWMAQWTQSGLTSGRTMYNRKCENVEVEATTTALIQH